jgi:thioredoxin-dependent peroxiredoxin
MAVLTSADYFAGKRVVVFALPGAFTPTCSSSHLPGYEANYDQILAEGIDEVYCLSVNDVRVMIPFHKTLLTTKSEIC